MQLMYSVCEAHLTQR